MLDSRTIRNFNTVNAGLTVLQILGNNLLRKAFMLSPVAGQSAQASALTAAVFTAGAGQVWTVPAGVTQIVSAYAWGAGGSSGNNNDPFGGGGGGGGAFAASGPITVVPGQNWSVTVDAGGGAGSTRIVDPTATTRAQAGSGTNGLLDANGVAGVATVGTTQQNGGDGAAATGLPGTGGGGGGAGGSYANGAAAAGAVGGVGGGGATLLSYGKGGDGASAGNTGTPGVKGSPIGGGASGPGSASSVIGVGGDGLAVIFYLSSQVNSGISIDQDPHLVLGQGSLNYLFGQTYPTLVTREQIGDAIRDPWYVISGLASQPVRVTEYSYVPEE